MDLEQLVANIEKARDEALEKAQEHRRQADEAQAQGGVTGAALALGYGEDARTFDAIATTLSRILGDPT